MYNLYIMEKILLEDSKPNIRTQITLTTSLKKAIEIHRRLYGESLSEYLRKAALTRLLVETEEKKELATLARHFTRPKAWDREHPYWKNKAGVISWLKKTRAEWEE